MNNEEKKRLKKELQEMDVIDNFLFTEIVITGVKTTLPFQKRVLHNRSFVEGKYDTGFVEKMMKERPNAQQKES